ncbi:hypothetical protein E2980_23820 [Cohnella luojiensis]|uniref:Uncharacterized protein n=1 Tax=Cohnella luojiensis TaxID=652876 RepID=A0A4Y8LMH6_9BACL|nr:hypothetical protein E2980_23820 [Cohnella luojiensis]
MKFVKKYKVLISIGVVFFLTVASTQYLKPHYTYRIIDNEQAINKSISKMVDQPIQIKLMKDIDNKRIVLFTLGSEIGESVLTKGSNNKFKLDSTGYGSNEVRYRIINTNKGQYVKFIGRNTDNISKILTIVDGEKYYLSVLEAGYFISYVPLIQKTESNFPSGSVWYDNQDKEIIRINISKDYIL